MSELREIATMLFIINLITLAAVVFVIGVSPVVTRKSLLFGVRIPEEATKIAKVVILKKSYIKIMMIGGTLALILLIGQYLLWPEISLLAALYIPLLMIVLQFIVFVSSWKKAMQLKEENNWVVPMTATVDTSSAVQREKMSVFSKGWYIISALIILVLIVLSIVKYPSLPAQVPTHWGFDMKPDAWSDKSFLTVLMMPLISLFILGAMMLGNITVYRMKLQVSSEHPELSYAQHRLYRRMMTEAIGISTLVVTVFLGLIQLMAIDVYIPPTSVMVVAAIIMLVAMCIPFTYVYFKAGQGGCKLNPPINMTMAKEDENIKARVTKAFNRGDDKFWKLGMFYYNEDDPAVLIEDRFGMNTGFNYARFATKIAVALLIIMAVAVYISTTIMFFTI